MFSTSPYVLLHLDPPLRRVGGRSFRWENYSWFYPGREIEHWEITYLQEGSVIVPQNGENVTYPQGSLRVFCHKGSGYVTSPDPVLHEIFMTFRPVEPPVPISEEDVANWRSAIHYAILPDHVTDPAVCEKVSLLLKTAVKAIHSEDCIAPSLRARTCLYEILTILTEYSVRTARRRLAAPQSRSRYTKKACAYVREHLGEKLTVSEVAEAAGISYNHLKTVFQKDMNMPLVEYINRQRIRRVEHLITTGEHTLEEAGAAVGIHDPKYLSRLFRRYAGMTVTEFRRISQYKYDL